MPYGPHSTSGPPGGGATSQGSGRDFSPPARDYSPPVRDHHPGTPVAIVQDQRTGEVKVVNVPSNEDLLKGDILQGPDLPVTGVEGPPSIISGPQVLPGADPHGDFETFIETEPRLKANVLTEGDIGYEIPYDYPEYDEQGNIIKYEDPPPVTIGGEGDVYTPPVTQADVTPEDTEFTPEDDAAAVAALGYGTDFPTDTGVMPYPNYEAVQGDLSNLIDPRMRRDYAENIKLMTDERMHRAAAGGRAGYYNGELVENDDEEETHRASALASLPEYRLFSQRRKAMLGGRMNYNQGGIVGLRQPAAFGGIMGPDGRRGYFLGSIGKVFKSITKPIKKIVKSPVGKLALLGGLGYLGTTGKFGFPKVFGEGTGGFWQKLNPINLFKQSEETKKLSTALKTAIEAGEYEKAANIKKLISGTKGGLSKMDMAAAVGIPLAMAGTAAYAGKTEGTDMGEMNKYLAEQDKRADVWRNKYGREFNITSPDFMYPGYRAAQGGRIGYRDAGSVSQYDLIDQLIEKYLAEGLSPNAARRKAMQELMSKAQGGRIGYADGLTVAEKGPLYIDPDTDLPLHNIEKKFQRMNKEERLKEYFDMLKRIESYKELVEVGARPYEEFLHWGPMGGDEISGGGSGNIAMTEALEYTDHPAAEALYERGEHYNRGGRIGYRGGKGVTSLQAGAPDIKYEGDMRTAKMDMIALEFEQEYGYDMMLAEPELREFFIKQWMNKNFYDKSQAPGRDRVMAQEGGLMDLGGMEKDYRQEGGFVPIGAKEKADDVPARLSKNEFVFTADAVRAAGGGNIDKGAEVMENLMENLEAGGKVSEESQGLEGARSMFANAQQLQNRII